VELIKEGERKGIWEFKKDVVKSAVKEEPLELLEPKVKKQ